MSLACLALVLSCVQVFLHLKNCSTYPASAPEQKFKQKGMAVFCESEWTYLIYYAFDCFRVRCKNYFVVYDLHTVFSKLLLLYDAHA